MPSSTPSVASARQPPSRTRWPSSLPLPRSSPLVSALVVAPSPAPPLLPQLHLHQLSPSSVPASSATLLRVQPNLPLRPLTRLKAPRRQAVKRRLSLALRHRSKLLLLNSNLLRHRLSRVSKRANNQANRLNPPSKPNPPSRALHKRLGLLALLLQVVLARQSSGSGICFATWSRTKRWIMGRGFDEMILHS